MSVAKNNIAVTILGSGTCVPSLARSASAVLMETGGKRLLFDIGPGTMRRLLETGVTIHDIDCLFISHFHPDHTGELASFLFATKYPDASTRKKPLVLCGGPGLTSFYRALADVYRGWLDLPDILDIREFNGDDPEAQAISFDEFSVSAARVVHRPESIAFRVETPHGISAVLSGDTEYSENLVLLARQTDLLICEAALPDDMEVPGHMTPSLAGKTASEAGVGSLVLSHFYPECDHSDMEGQCRKTWDGPLLLAVDLLKINARKHIGP